MDAGSGEGYGAGELTEVCERGVVGVELDAPTAAHARVRYPALAQVQANLVALPFQPRSFSAAVSLQVIEHIWDPLAYLSELSRCTNGPIAVSTPNRLVHSPGLGRGEQPMNPFHVREFDARELVELLTSAVPDRTPTIYALFHGERLRAWEQRNGSLPSSLLEANVTSDTLQFARTVEVADFPIELIDLHEPRSEIHDLVALW